MVRKHWLFRIKGLEFKATFDAKNITIDEKQPQKTGIESVTLFNDKGSSSCFPPCSFVVKLGPRKDLRYLENPSSSNQRSDFQSVESEEKTTTYLLTRMK